uniref:Peptidase S8/S53 domain-containing protein n=1 Tax=Panagrolaimus sp. ES5 TaxID=591445 RepID=A0AC34FUZ4_9BILA
MKVLSNFDDDQEIAYISKSELIYGVDISDDGNLIQIFFPYDNHATLVSHVAAAYFPDNPESNGLAPGAQIISMHAFKFEEAV